MTARAAQRARSAAKKKTQSALFALAVADVLLVNVWCHDIGREQGSGKPLMKTIFQVGGCALRALRACVRAHDQHKTMST